MQTINNKTLINSSYVEYATFTLITLSQIIISPVSIYVAHYQKLPTGKKRINGKKSEIEH